jgi:hypothetical protein
MFQVLSLINQPQESKVEDPFTHCDLKAIVMIRSNKYFTVHYSTLSYLLSILSRIFYIKHDGLMQVKGAA